MISDYLQTLQNSIFEKNPLLGIFPNPVFEMVSMPHLQTLLSAKPTATVNRAYSSCTSSNCESVFLGSKISLRSRSGNKKQKPATVVAAFGDVSSDGTTYLIAGAAAVALLGTGFPILFSRKDLCPECDGAGFVRKSGATLRANAARKDQAQIVCPRCNGLGKLNQIDK